MYENAFETNILLELVNAGLIDNQIMEAVLAKLRTQKAESRDDVQNKNLVA